MQAFRPASTSSTSRHGSRPSRVSISGTKTVLENPAIRVSAVIARRASAPKCRVSTANAGSYSTAAIHAPIASQTAYNANGCVICDQAANKRHSPTEPPVMSRRPPVRSMRAPTG